MLNNMQFPLLPNTAEKEVSAPFQLRGPGRQSQWNVPGSIFQQLWVGLGNCWQRHGSRSNCVGGLAVLDAGNAAHCAARVTAQC